jgi:copper chaperone CopZ
LRKQKAEEMDCDCETEETQPFMQSKQFLGIVTVLAVVMMAYPLYGDSVYAALAGTTISGSQTLSGQTKTEVYKIKGMTCSSCEEHVKHEVGALSGVVKIEVDYGKGTAAVTYDQDLALTESIIDAINATGYEYIGMKHIGESNE